MSAKKQLKQFPEYASDEAAERFVDEADLSEFDFSKFQPTRFEFEKKTAQVNLRMPESMLRLLKERAKARGIPYQRLIREALEKALQ